MSLWQIQHLSQVELLQLLSESLNPEVSGSLDAMPAFLRESLLFPYTAGLSFVQSLQASGGWDAVNGAFREPPASTEQVLHPEKYASHEAPVDVTLPADLPTKLGRAGRRALEDTLGEFQLKVWLDQVAAGSGGPSAPTRRRPAGAATGWCCSTGRTAPGRSSSRRPGTRAADAAEFAAAANSVVAKLRQRRGDPGRRRHGRDRRPRVEPGRARSRCASALGA